MGLKIKIGWSKRRKKNKERGRVVRKRLRLILGIWAKGITNGMRSLSSVRRGKQGLLTSL